MLFRSVKKSLFWQQHREVSMNERQVKVVNMLWDGFDGKLTTSKWAKITKSSQATALRDVTDLVEKGAAVLIPIILRAFAMRWKGRKGNCKGGVEHYECKDCGHTFDIAVGYAVTGHTFSSDYKHNDKNHWQICTVCGVAGPLEKHDLKQKKVFKDCTKTIVTTVCETCGYTHQIGRASCRERV